MILRSLISPVPSGGENSGAEFVPVWDAIEKIQNEKYQECWLMTQPAHSALAGEISRHLRWEDQSLCSRESSQPQRATLMPSVAAAPILEEKIVRAISLHDAGWGQLDAAVIQRMQSQLDASMNKRSSNQPGTRDGRREEHPRRPEPVGKPNGSLHEAAHSNFPLPFLQVSLREVLPAWSASIEVAACDSAEGGYMVSRHFCRLIETRLEDQSKQPLGHEVEAQPTVGLIRDFLRKELQRQQSIVGGGLGNTPHGQRRSREELEMLVDILQFCDGLSLYICCGATENVVFPQQLRGESIRLHRDARGGRLEPSPLAAEVTFKFSALRYPKIRALSSEQEFARENFPDQGVGQNVEPLAGNAKVFGFTLR